MCTAPCCALRAAHTHSTQGSRASEPPSTTERGRAIHLGFLPFTAS